MRWPTRSRVGVLATCAALGISLAVVGVSLPRQHVLASEDDGVPISSVAPAPSAVTTPDVVSSPSPSGSPAPLVAPAAPVRISFTVFDTVKHKTVKTDDPVGVVRVNRRVDGVWDTIKPPEDNLAQLGTAFWWDSDVSLPPGDPSQGTSYIYAHSCNRQNPPEPDWLWCAFDELMYLNAGDPKINRPPDQVTLTTPAGVLTYQVTQNATEVKKDDLAGNSTVFWAYPNRLVLITCAHAGDSPLGQYIDPSNWVVQLLLVDSRPIVPSK